MTEFEEAKKIYKKAGIIIAVILLIGIIIAVIGAIKNYQPTKQIIPEMPQIKEEKLEPIAENTTVENITINETIQNITLVNQTIENLTTENATNITLNQTNTTQNTTENLTLQVTNTAPAQQPRSWETMTITFPAQKRYNTGQKIFYYIDIKEADTTPATNGEQFEIKTKIKDKYGKTTEYRPNYEYNKWLTLIIPTNPGIYTITITIKCEDQQGYCKRFYDEEKALDATTEIEVV